MPQKIDGGYYESLTDLSVFSWNWHTSRWTGIDPHHFSGVSTTGSPSLTLTEARRRYHWVYTRMAPLPQRTIARALNGQPPLATGEAYIDRMANMKALFFLPATAGTEWI